MRGFSTLAPHSLLSQQHWPAGSGVWVQVTTVVFWQQQVRPNMPQVDSPCEVQPHDWAGGGEGPGVGPGVGEGAGGAGPLALTGYEACAAMPQMPDEPTLRAMAKTRDFSWDFSPLCAQ